MVRLRGIPSSHMPHQYADISIDADNFTDGDFVTMSNPAHSGAARITPVAPQIRLPCRMILRKHRRRFLRSPQDRRLSCTAHRLFKEHRMLQVHRASTTHRICRKCKFIVPCRTIFIAPQAAEHSAEKYFGSAAVHRTQHTDREKRRHARSAVRTYQSGNTAASRRNS